MTLTKRIVPCIDVDVDETGEAAVYTGVNFDDLEHTGDPVELARKYNEAGADAALAASIFHFEEYTVDEVKRYLDDRGVPMRV